MINRKEFSDKVEKLMSGGKSDVMSAILKVCEEHLLEPESAKRLLTNPLREKLEAEATKMNLVNRGRNSQGTLTSFYE